MWPSEQYPAVQANESAAWQHLRIQPTRLGAGLMMMVLLLWLVGLNYQANLAYVAAFWLLGFVVAATLQNLRQLLGLQLVWQMPSEIFAATPVELTLRAVQPMHRRWLWVKQARQDHWQEWRLTDAEADLKWPVTVKRRGHLHLPTIHVASSAPFGICTVEAVWQWQSDKVVFPAPLPHDVPTGFYCHETRETRAVFAQSSDDLSHLQVHEDGTSLQSVAWKVYAKTGQMLDKRFDAVEQGSGSHIISYRDYPSGASVDRLAGWLCFRVLEAERNGTHYELELPHQWLSPQKGQREMCLTALALWS